MDEKDWYTLLALHEKKSITKTAEALFISQPALTSRLQQIEKRFDTKIVVRSKSGVQFTPEGTYLVECAEEMIKRMRGVEENIKNMRVQPTGTLRIGAANFFSKYLLPELLRQFRLQYPMIEFEVITVLSRDIAKLVQNNEVHIGFVRGEYNWQNEKMLLFSEKMYISSNTPLVLTDLLHMPQIDYQKDYTIQMDVEKWWMENFALPPRIGMKVDKVDTSMRMVEKGLGYALLPELLLRNSKLHTYEMPYRSGESVICRTWMFYNKEVIRLNMVKVFYEFIKNINFLQI